MNDKEIRTALIEKLRRENFSNPDALLVEELGLCEGKSLLDLALVTDHIDGFEIKSDQDTLNRLSRQQAIYSRVLRTATLVAGSVHIERVPELIPDWWGIVEALSDSGQALLIERRRPRPNPSVDLFLLAQLIWKPEALQLLAEIGIARGNSNKNREILRKRLIEEYRDDFPQIVARILKSRPNWPKRGHRF